MCIVQMYICTLHFVFYFPENMFILRRKYIFVNLVKMKEKWVFTCWEFFLMCDDLFSFDFSFVCIDLCCFVDLPLSLQKFKPALWLIFAEHAKMTQCSVLFVKNQTLLICHQPVLNFWLFWEVEKLFASWFVCSTPDRVVRVWTLARGIVLCSWARHSHSEGTSTSSTSFEFLLCFHCVNLSRWILTVQWIF